MAEMTIRFIALRMLVVYFGKRPKTIIALGLSIPGITGVLGLVSWGRDRGFWKKN